MDRFGPKWSILIQLELRTQSTYLPTGNNQISPATAYMHIKGTHWRSTPNTYLTLASKMRSKSTHAHNNWCKAEYSRDCKSEYEEHTRTQ